MSEWRKRATTARLERERRRALVADLYLEGMNGVQIASRLGVTQTVIYRDVRCIRKEWQDTRLKSFEEIVAVELRKLDKIEMSAWDGWKRSLLERSRNATTKRAKPGEDGRPIPTYAETREAKWLGSGNPHFLEILLKCAERRARLLGLDEQAVKLIVTDTSDRALRMHEIVMQVEQNRQVQVIDAEWIDKMYGPLPAEKAAVQEPEDGDVVESDS